MNRKWLLGLSIAFIVMITLSYIFSGPDPVTGETTDRSTMHSPQSGELRVVSATPQGLVEDVDQFYSMVVIFSKPMVPLQALPEGNGSGPLVIDPPIEGKFRWQGTNTLVFTPAKSLPLASRFTVTVPAGIKCVTGESLQQNYQWSFETQRPKLMKSSLDDNATGISVTPVFYFLFNQTMSLNDLRTKIRLTENSSGRPVSLIITKADTNDLKDYFARHYDYYYYDYNSADVQAQVKNRIYKIKTTASLTRSMDYTLEIMSDLRGEAGYLGTVEPKRFYFSTHGDLSVLQFSEPLHPGSYLSFEFSTRVDADELQEKISITPASEIKYIYNSYWDNPNTVNILFDLKAQTRYKIKIDKSLTDEFDQPLGSSYQCEFKTGDFEPAVTFLGGTHVVESYLGHLFYAYALNPQEVDLKMSKLDQSKLIELNRNDWTWSQSLDFMSWDFTWNGVPQVVPNQIQRVPIDLDRALKQDKSGVILVEMKHQPWTYPQRALIQITDMSITAKFSKLSNLIHVTALKDASPVGGAFLEIRDNQGNVKWTGQTDANGFAKTPGWEALGIQPVSEYYEPLQWVFAQKGDQKAYAYSGETIELYRFNVNYSWGSRASDQVDCELFTNQGIYRPGDKVHIKGIARTLANDQWTINTHQEISLEIKNPDYETLLTKTLIPNRFGGITMDYSVEENARLGYYTISASVGGKHIASESFQVQEFKPVETEVTVNADKKSYVWGEKLKATFDAHYLFGAPMSNSDIQYSVTRNYSGYTPPGFEDYYFGSFNEEDYYYRGYGYRGFSSVLVSQTSKVNARGLMDIELPLSSQNYAETSQLVIEGTVQDKNRQTVSGRSSVTVHAGQFYIGLKPSTTFHTQGTPLTLNVLAVTPEGKKVDNKKISVQLTRRQWFSVRQKTEDGSYEWTSQSRDTVESSQTVTTTDDELAVSLNPRSTGYYLVHATSADAYGNTIKSTCFIYVTGAMYAGWKMYNEDVIDIFPNKKSYNPGETAKILVKSPYAVSRALITVEREGVMYHKTEILTGNVAVIQVPIVKDMIPNVFISVMLLQGRTALPKADQKEDLGKPQFKIGYTTLNVNSEENKLSVTVKPNKTKFAPQEWVDVDLTVKDKSGNGQAAELVVYVEDIGVLNLISYKTPQPFDLFYKPRELSVKTFEGRKYVLDQILQKNMMDQKGLTGGGGGEEGYFPSISMRKDFKACVYWNPSVPTDANGKAKVRFQLPDNLTAFRIIAVAHTASSKFGSADKNITVSKPLMLRPSLPRFARAGDDVEAGVIVHNYSDETGNVRLAASFDGVIMNDSLTRTFTLKEGESKEVRFRFRVNQIKNAKISFKAEMNKYTDGVEVIIPFKIPTYTETVALYNSVTDEKRLESLIVPGQIYADAGGLELKTSSTALVDLDAGVRYLFDYPYGCLEQKTSKALPIILFADVVRAFNLPGFRRDGQQNIIKASSVDMRSMEEVVQDYLDEVPKYQKYDGGFGYWTSSEYVSPYVSAFAMFAMTQAKQKGYQIDQTCYNKGITYLKQIVRNPSIDHYGLYYWHMTNTLALYVLSDNNYYDASSVELLFQRREEMPLYARAMLLKAVYKGKGHGYMIEELKRSLANSIKMSSTTAHFEEPVTSGLEWTFHSNVRTTAAVLEAFLMIDGVNVPWAEKVVRYLLQERKIGRWRTTQENLYVFWSLGTYFSVFEKDIPDFSSQIQFEGRSLLNEIYRGRTTKTATSLVSLADLPKDRELPLTISKSGAGRLYYTIRMTYAPKRGVNIPAKDEGIQVTKTYEDLKGNAVTDGIFKAGDMYRVRLKVSVAQDRNFIVVDDPLPAGFEAVNVNLATSSHQDRDKIASSAKKGWWLYGEFNNSELRDDRVLVFADWLSRGTHTFDYLVRATTYGSFEVPPTKAEEMYAPEVFGNTANHSVQIK